MLPRASLNLAFTSSVLIRWIFRFLSAAIFAASSVVPVDAQSDDVIKFNVDLVTVNVAVKDGKGRSLPGLKPQDFLITDQNSPVVPEFFDSEGPASVVFVVDTSSSMKGTKWKSLMDGFKDFLKKARNGNDYTLIAFSNSPRLLAQSVNAAELSNHLRELKADGGTALYDGVLIGLDVLKQVPQRHKALVLVSDGEDNESHQGLAEVEKEAWSHHTTIYSIGILLKDYCKKNSKEACSGQETIKKLAQATGGLAFFPDYYELAGVLRDINKDVSSQYSLSYYPPDKRTGWREVRVAVTPTERRPKLRYQQRYLMK